MREINYKQNGDYLIPEIELEETMGIIGKYGMMRREYLREHKSGTFNILILQDQLDQHLMEIDREARRKIESLSEQLMKENPAPDKETDPMGWTRCMNQIKAQAEEMVLAELIYN